MKNFESLVDALRDLNKRGYTADLTLAGDSLEAKNEKVNLYADDFEINEFYKFEGATNPSDTSILYAIESKKHNLKGVLINAYGVYANTSSSAIEAKLNHYHIK